MGQMYTTPSTGVIVPYGIVIPGNLPLAAGYGSVLLAQLNRIKTTPADFGRIHKIPPDYIMEVIEGKNAPNSDLLIAIERSSPLNVREMIHPQFKHRVPIFDDSIDGVVVCSSAASNGLHRVYYRGNNEKFYTYHHTAVQKKSPIIPEKIIEHYPHDPRDVDLGDDFFNRGHRERQITTAVGDVNYHWVDNNGRKQVISAKTGDANAINHFTRHSFTVPPGKSGFILAVTDLGAIGNEYFQCLTQVLEPEEYLKLIRKVLPVVQSSTFDELGGFVFRRHEEGREVQQGRYTRRILMDGITFHPGFVATELELGKVQGDGLDIKVNAYVWGYNHGENPVAFRWGSRQVELEPGSSFSIQKNVPHAFGTVDGLEGKLIIMESNPDEENPFEQLALVGRFVGEEGLLRAVYEKKLWFKDGGKK